MQSENGIAASGRNGERRRSVSDRESGHTPLRGPRQDMNRYDSIEQFHGKVEGLSAEEWQLIVTQSRKSAGGRAKAAEDVSGHLAEQIMKMVRRKRTPEEKEAQRSATELRLFIKQHSLTINGMGAPTFLFELISRANLERSPMKSWKPSSRDRQRRER